MSSTSNARANFLATLQSTVEGAADFGSAKTMAAPTEEESAKTMAADSIPSAPRSSAPAIAQADGERYQLLEVIGEGGMGRVHGARDKQFGRVVALKELRGEAFTTDAVRRFVQEAVVTANLEHPGVVAVYERGVRNGSPFYAMRKVQGRTLADAIREAPALADRVKLLPVLVRVAHTLGYAHERGVVHRDVKPENVLLGTHGETVLLDWGIAKVDGLRSADVVAAALPGVDTGAKTVAGHVMGTPAYMAPEQAKGDSSAIDARTDVFAVGAMLYELLAGHPPYRGPTLASVLGDAAQGQRVELAKAAPDAPSALRAIAERALATNPADRYASAAELASVLEDFQAGALLGEDSRAVRWFSALAGATAFLVMLVAIVMTARTVASFREQGNGAFATAAFTLLGLSLSAIEWRTAGRYRLNGLAAALAGATAMVGIANTTSGMSMVFRALASHETLADGARYRALFTEGMYEALGSGSSALVYAAFQWVVLALAARSVANAARANVGSKKTVTAA